MEGAPIYLVVGRHYSEAGWYPVRWRATFEEAFELAWLLYEQAFELSERMKDLREARHAAWCKRLLPYPDYGFVPDPDGTLAAAHRIAEDAEAVAQVQFAVHLFDRRWADVHRDLQLESIHFSPPQHDGDGVWGLGGFAYAIWEVAG